MTYRPTVLLNFTCMYLQVSAVFAKVRYCCCTCKAHNWKSKKNSSDLLEKVECELGELHQCRPLFRRLQILLPKHVAYSMWAELLSSLKFRCILTNHHLPLYAGANSTYAFKKDVHSPFTKRTGSQASEEEIAQLLSQIKRDLTPWQKGISLEMVERLYCIEASSLTTRIQVLPLSCSLHTKKESQESNKQLVRCILL